jgi:hypothetical protein
MRRHWFGRWWVGEGGGVGEGCGGRGWGWGGGGWGGGLGGGGGGWRVGGGSRGWVGWGGMMERGRGGGGWEGGGGVGGGGWGVGGVWGPGDDGCWNWLGLFLRHQVLSAAPAVIVSAGMCGGAHGVGTPHTLGARRLPRDGVPPLRTASSQQDPIRWCSSSDFTRRYCLFVLRACVRRISHRGSPRWHGEALSHRVDVVTELLADESPTATPTIPEYADYRLARRERVWCPTCSEPYNTRLNRVCIPMALSPRATRLESHEIPSCLAVSHDALTSRAFKAPGPRVHSSGRTRSIASWVLEAWAHGLQGVSYRPARS